MLAAPPDVRTLVLASSSEVYQTPPKVPTDESVPMVVPDPHNPRLSYGAGKIISEVMAINYGRKFFDRVLIFRPHNVYGPDMGFEHVIPQFALRMKKAIAQHVRCTGAIRDPGRRAANPQLLPYRRSGARRHDHARQGRASRYLSRRHQRGDRHRRFGAADRGITLGETST